MNGTCRAALIALVWQLVGLPSFAAEPQEEQEPLPLRESGLATLELAPERRFPVAYGVTAIGPVFTLHSLVAHLGGELRLGPLNQAHELAVGGTTFVFGPDSASLTAGTEIHPLSQRPVIAEDGLRVPLDLLQTVYGEQLSYVFRWEASSRTLSVRQLPAREVSVQTDLVELQGVTTVVLQFSERPRYRLRKSPGQVAVELVGDRLQVQQPRLTPPGNLVREILQTPQGIRLVLAPNAEANEYSLENPFRLVLDVYRSSTTAAVPSPTLLPTPPVRESGIRTIVIDPGHGGSNTGARGSGGAAEKELTLLLARALRSRLMERLPVRVVLTRNEDVDLPLETRTAIANQQKADLFISLHVNSVPGGGASGAETYFLSSQETGERPSQAADGKGLARSAPSGGGDPLYDLQLVLWDLAQSRYLSESQQLAGLVQEELNETLGPANRRVKQAPFRILVGAAMPAILVECGFLSNPKEEARLLDASHRARLVEALVRAIARFRMQTEGLSIPADEVLP